MYENYITYHLNEICNITTGYRTIDIDTMYSGKYPLIIDINLEKNYNINIADHFEENIIIPIFFKGSIKYIDYPFSTTKFNIIINIKEQYKNIISLKYLYYYFVINYEIFSLITEDNNDDDELNENNEIIINTNKLSDLKIKLPIIEIQLFFNTKYENLLKEFILLNKEIINLEEEFINKYLQTTYI